MRSYFMPASDPLKRLEPQIDAKVTPTRLLLRTMLAYPRLIFLAAGLEATASLAATMIPVIVGSVIDGPIASGNSRELWWWLTALTGVFLLQITCEVFGRRSGYLSARYVDHTLRMTVTDRVMDPRGVGGRQRLPGALLSIAASDAATVARVKILAVYPAGDIVAVVAATAVLLTISWPLALLTMGGFPIIVFIADKAGQPLEKKAAVQQEVAAQTAGMAADLVSAARTVKGLRAEAEAASRYRASSQRALQATIGANRADAGLHASVGLLGSLYLIMVAMTAATMTFQEHVSVGQLIVVVSLAQMVIGPMTSLGAFSGSIWAHAKASAKRVLSVVQAPFLLRSGFQPGDDAGDGSKPVAQLDFGAAAPDLEICLGDLQIRVPAGKTVVWKLPAELSTELIERLSLRRIPESGFALINGTDLADLDPLVTRETILVSPGDPGLFAGTIWENVALGNKNSDWVETCLRAAGCADIVQALPQGLDTPVGQAGSRLSGGQRQRVALARALTADPPVLLLNNPTTAVDSVTEYTVAQAVAQLREGKSTIIISDSPAWFGGAETVFSYSTSSGIGSSSGIEDTNAS